MLCDTPSFVLWEYVRRENGGAIGGGGQQTLIGYEKVSKGAVHWWVGV
jgi:hypothetical protein